MADIIKRERKAFSDYISCDNCKRRTLTATRYEWGGKDVWLCIKCGKNLDATMNSAFNHEEKLDE